jgi:hypothetical protein
MSRRQLSLYHHETYCYAANFRNGDQGWTARCADCDLIFVTRENTMVARMQCIRWSEEHAQSNPL